ncbi:MAG: hypothetical protein E6J78_02495 [Deltaproteobacteria bacterium]|nr:MAG: hypothetical protein E6J78_02495 [Deltaproteobacteria bacterium]
MAILQRLKGEGVGDWPSLGEFLRAARRRDSSALAALGAALGAPPAEQKELAQGDGAAVLLELACDLRAAKAARLAAARCLVETEAGDAGKLFAGAGDLLTDPRLGGSARKLVEKGLPAALKSDGELGQVSLAAGAFARAVHAASSAVGQPKVKEMLASAPQGHAGTAAGLFALGQGELSQDQREAWEKLLEAVCTAWRRAPDAAKRMGLVPAWPPNLPDAFAPLVQEAEKKMAAVQPPAAVAAAKAPSPTKPAAEPKRPPATTEVVGQKKLAPPIKRSQFRRPTGVVVEVPAKAPRKPMEPLIGRPLPLPSSELPPPMKAAVAPGPFAQRLRSLFDNRPEAIDRLCAAADARAAVAGENQLLAEVSRELSHKRWHEARAPREQLERLRAIAQDEKQPAQWRGVARLLLDRLKTA